MFTIIICDKDSSQTHLVKYDPKTKEEFDECIKNGEKIADETFSRYFLDVDDMDATDDQIQWIEEYFY